MHITIPSFLLRAQTIRLCVLFVQGVLIVAAGNAFAQLFWAAFPNKTAFAPFAVMRDVSPAPSQLTLDPKALLFFGTVPPKPIQSVPVAPIKPVVEVKRADIRLVGISFDPKGTYSMAMLTVNGNEHVFETGESIDTHTVLHRIAPNYIVILFNDEEEQQIELPSDVLNVSLSATEEDNTALVPGKNLLSAVTAVSLTGGAGNRVQRYRQLLERNPLSLTDVLGFTPYSDASVSGVRVSPGIDRELFFNLGLKEGDVIESLFGIALSTPENMRKIYAKLTDRGTTVVEAVVYRQGARKHIAVRLK